MKAAEPEPSTTEASSDEEAKEAQRKKEEEALRQLLLKSQRKVCWGESRGVYSPLVVSVSGGNAGV